MNLEVIATSLADVRLINESIADRIEFCTNLEVGGLTPTYREILEVTSESKIPVNVMVRPTNRDFYYTEAEFLQMLEDIKFIASSKANGIVIGILNEDQTINIDRMLQVMAVKGDKQVIFHRAFDQITDQIVALQQLQDLGVDGVLTSGNGNIDASTEILSELQRQHKITIIGGGGVTLHNLAKIANVVDEIHVGTAIRENYLWDKPIKVDEITKFKSFLIKT